MFLKSKLFFLLCFTSIQPLVFSFSTVTNSGKSTNDSPNSLTFNNSTLNTTAESYEDDSSRNGTQKKEKLNPKTSFYQATDVKLLFSYRTYRDVQITYYSVPQLTSMASWRLESNVTQSKRCKPKKIHFFLRFGGYPVVNGDNSSFPSEMFLGRNYFTSISFETDNGPKYLNLSNPLPGDWFSVSYIEEDTHKIVQKGLFTICQAWLHTHVKYFTEESVIALSPGTPLSTEVNDEDKLFKFYTSHDIWTSEITISKCSLPNTEINGNGQCPVDVYSRPLALPLGNANESSINCSSLLDLAKCRLEVLAVEDGWNYVLIKASSFAVLPIHFEISVNYAACQDSEIEISDVPHHSFHASPNIVKTISLNQRSETLPNMNNNITLNENLFLDNETMNFGANVFYSPISKSCWPRIHLVRNNLNGNFAFRFDQLPDGNDSTPVLVNFSMNAISLLSFPITPLLDTGGTLAIEMVLPKTLNTTEKNVSVSICLEHLFRPSLDLATGMCLSPMNLSVNTTSYESRFGTLLIPFPQSGQWYMSLRASCYVAEQSQNESGVEEPYFVPCDDNHTSVFLQIKSSPCIQGQCGGPYGNCYQYISGSFIYSTCVCGGGWRGWDCSDNSHAIPNSELLTSVLLLTISNAFFLPAIILAVRRRYFTEAAVYLVTTFFSTMYHACDAEIFYYCLMKLSVLQFCDFYSAILSVWVTAIAMAEIPITSPVQSLVHVMGAFGVAVGVEYDRTGLWVFVVPVAVGLFIILLYWSNRCRKTHSCYPKKKTWLLCLLPGFLTAGTGLALYSILETKSNYQYVHSGWHICMAICILFLLPEKRKSKEKELWEDDSNVNCNSYAQVEVGSEVSTFSSSESDNHSDEQLIPTLASHI